MTLPGIGTLVSREFIVTKVGDSFFTASLWSAGECYSLSGCSQVPAPVQQDWLLSVASKHLQSHSFRGCDGFIRRKWRAVRPLSASRPPWALSQIFT